MHAMKRLAIAGLPLLLCTFSSSRGKASADTRKDNLYSVALFASVSEMEKSWGHIDDGDGGRGIRTDYRNMLLEKEPEITDDLPSRQGDYRVECLDSRELRDKYSKLRKQFAVLAIHPMQNDGALLRIQVSVEYAMHQNHKFVLALSDWSDVEFRYDCEKQKFVISSIKLGGI